MSLWKPKCKLCGEPTKLFGAPKIKMQTMEGQSTLRICESCAITLEEIRNLKDGKELPPLNYIEDT